MYYVVRRSEYFVKEFDNLHDAEWHMEILLEQGISDTKIIRSKQGIHEYKKRHDDCETNSPETAR